MLKIKIILLAVVCFTYFIFSQNELNSEKIIENKNSIKQENLDIANNKNNSSKKIKPFYLYLELGPAIFINEYSVVTTNIDLIGFEFLINDLNFFIEIGSWSSSIFSHIPKFSIGAKYYFLKKQELNNLLNPFVGGGYTGAFNISNIEEIKYSNDLTVTGGNRFNFGLLNLHAGLTLYLISTFQLKPIFDINLAIGLNF